MKPLSADLVGWYRAHARALPWRTSPSPYRTLLSELMSQQTRIDTVLPYYDRFLTRWPTVEDLAAADVDEVLREWAGLGYYSRARNLHLAARAIVAAGGFPTDVAGLRALPGVGPYTAGAVASIAFDQPVPAIDGNVERVVTRVYAIEGDPHAPAVRRQIDARVRDWLVDAPPGDLNQALMELGASICAPRRPICTQCPWSSACAARASGDPERLPEKKKKAPPVPIRAVAGLLWDGPSILMGRRPPGLLGGLWEPIGAPIDDDRDPRAVLRSAFRERAGLDVRIDEKVSEIVHVFSHRRLTLAVYAVSGRTAEPRCLDHYEDVGWVDPERPEVALSTLARKTVAIPPLLRLAADR